MLENVNNSFVFCWVKLLQLITLKTTKKICAALHCVENKY